MANHTNIQDPAGTEINTEESTDMTDLSIRYTLIITEEFDKPRKCGECGKTRKVVRFQEFDAKTENTMTSQFCRSCYAFREVLVDSLNHGENIEITDEPAEIEQANSTGAPAFILTGVGELDGKEMEAKPVMCARCKRVFEGGQPEACDNCRHTEFEGWSPGGINAILTDEARRPNLLSSEEVAALIQSTYSVPGTVYRTRSNTVSTFHYTQRLVENRITTTAELIANGHSEECASTTIRCCHCEARLCHWGCPKDRLKEMTEWAHHRAECVSSPEPEATTAPTAPNTPSRQPKAPKSAPAASSGPAYEGQVGPAAGEAMPKTFTDVIRKRVAQQYLSGASFDQLAKGWGRSVSSIKVIVSKFPNG